jgi:ATP-dependent DNA ligase
MVTLCAFDLIELDGRNLRREPIETRKAALHRLLRGARHRVVANAWVRGARRNRLPQGRCARL